MTWHATGKCMEPGKMQHPVDGRAWKNFDTKYPDFAKEPKNVQLGLAADGFNSFGNLSQSCNMWPQIFSQTLMEDDMLKAQSKVVDILCNLELIYPPSFFNIMIHLVIHLPLEALEGRPIRLWWIPEINTYQAKFKSEFANQDMKEEFPGWFGS
ncbi:F-box domain containing protein [Tanacetum coccineum]